MNAILEKLSKAAGYAWRAARMCGSERDPVQQIRIVPGRCENFPSNAEYMVADVEWGRSGKQVTALLHGTLPDEAREGKKELRVRMDQTMTGISVSSAKRGETHLTFFLKIIAEDGRPQPSYPAKTGSRFGHV